MTRAELQKVPYDSLPKGRTRLAQTQTRNAHALSVQQGMWDWGNGARRTPMATLEVNNSSSEQAPPQQDIAFSRTES